jgi:branched-chain amino acid transport system substrate-binding protein
VIPAGKAAVGYVAAGFHPSGADYPLVQEILDVVHGVGKGNISPQRVGTIYYNRGLIMGIISVEAVRTAQEMFGTGKRLTGEQVRWGIENLDITAARIKELGAEGLMSPIKVSCYDHEGGGAVKFQEWDGKKWNVITDWIETDQSLVRPMIEASAAKYAGEKGITMREGTDSYGSDCNVK